MIGFHKSTEPFEFDESRWLEHEKPSVLEAFRVLAKEGYYVSISGHDYNEREKRLKEECEKNTKSPGPGEEQPKEGNPALKEAASQFNDALLDEQAKKIKRLGKEIARLNGIIHEKNEEIKRKTKGCCELVAESVDLKEVLRKTESLLHDTREANSKNLHTCFKNEDIIDDLKKKLAEKTRLAKKYGKELEDSSLGLCKLEKKLADKNAVLSDVAEELRLSKIREKNLTEVCQKYMKENEELKNELDVGKKQNAAKMVDMTAKCFRAARESINDVFESYAAKYAKNTLDELKEKAYESFNAKACKLGLAGSKDGNGILDQMVWVDKAEEGGDHSAIIVQCYKDITTISKDEAEIIERCTKNGTELHYSEKDGFTYTNVFGDEMPIIYLRGMFQVFTDEEIKNMKK